MTQKPRHRINTARFIPFMVVAILLLVAVMFGLSRCDGTGSKSSNEPMNIKAMSERFSGRILEESWMLMLVNPWNKIPEGYQVTTATIPNKFNNDVDMLCDERVRDSLVAMLSDCQAAGYDPLIWSSYREHATQYRYFTNQVADYVAAGRSREEAIAMVAEKVAVPGTSEHELGMAFDIVERTTPQHNEAQENQPTTKWLHAHAHEYGFIIRYPKGAQDITGITYEPWHYRYVGVEAATEIHEKNITLEEYLGKEEHGEKVEYVEE